MRTSTGRKNDQLTAQWVTASVSELRAELLELARAHNDSAERAAHNDLRAQVRLARADAASTRRELERLRADHSRAVADLSQARQDVAALRAAHQLASKKCAETRQQVSQEFASRRRHIVLYSFCVVRRRQCFIFHMGRFATVLSSVWYVSGESERRKGLRVPNI